jgi:uncharacterized membrane protein
MSALVALLFNDPYKAEEARAAVHRMEGEGLLEMDETALVVKYPDGKMRISQDTDVVSRDQQIGHVAGLLTAAITGTMPFIMASTIGGRLLGRLTDNGITNRFLKDVQKGLEPGTSVLVLVGRSDPERRRKVLDRLRGWNPRILQSDLPPEMEQAFEEAVQQQRAA